MLKWFAIELVNCLLVPALQLTYPRPTTVEMNFVTMRWSSRDLFILLKWVSWAICSHNVFSSVHLDFLPSFSPFSDFSAQRFQYKSSDCTIWCIYRNFSVKLEYSFLLVVGLWNFLWWRLALGILEIVKLSYWVVAICYSRRVKRILKNKFHFSNVLERSK